MLPCFGDEATSLLIGLLKRNPRDRLGTNGIEEIKGHIFFDGMDWESLLARKIENQQGSVLISLKD